MKRGDKSIQQSRGTKQANILAAALWPAPSGQYYFVLPSLVELHVRSRRRQARSETLGTRNNLGPHRSLLRQGAPHQRRARVVGPVSQPERRDRPPAVRSARVLGEGRRR